MTKENLEEAHKHSLRNRSEIEASGTCGCFGCCRVFQSSEIEDWVDRGQTAMCPYCDVDAVIGDASGVKIDESLLRALHKRYF